MFHNRIKALFNSAVSSVASGISGFHSYKPEYVRQEIWAKLTACNITKALVSHVVIEIRDTKHDYQVDFSAATYICRVFLRQSAAGST